MVVFSRVTSCHMMPRKITADSAMLEERPKKWGEDITMKKVFPSPYRMRLLCLIYRQRQQPKAPPRSPQQPGRFSPLGAHDKTWIVPGALCLLRDIAELCAFRQPTQISPQKLHPLCQGRDRHSATGFRDWPRSVDRKVIGIQLSEESCQRATLVHPVGCVR